MNQSIIADDNGTLPRVVGALADCIHVARARGAVQQRAGLCGGRAGGQQWGELARELAPRTAHIPVPRCRRSDFGRRVECS